MSPIGSTRSCNLGIPGPCALEGWFARLLLGWGVLVVSMVDNVIRSWFLHGAARVPFLLGFFGVLGGLLAFGPIGLFLGPITMALLLTLWRDWTRPETTAA